MAANAKNKNVPEKSEAPAAKDAAPAKNRPVKVFRVDDVSASVWSRTVFKLEESFTYYSISFQRRYVSNGETKYSGFLNPGDLPKLVKLCKQAEDYLIELESASAGQ